MRSRSRPVDMWSPLYPGAIVMLLPGQSEFASYPSQSREALDLCTSPPLPMDACFLGEYFGNDQRDEVHIYASQD